MRNELDGDLATKNRLGLEKEIVRLREGIRYAFSQAFDSKCWFDYFKLNDLLPEKPTMDFRMLSEEEMMENCLTFIRCMKCYLANPDKSIDELYEIWERVKPYDNNS